MAGRYTAVHLVSCPGKCGSDSAAHKTGGASEQNVHQRCPAKKVKRAKNRGPGADLLRSSLPRRQHSHCAGVKTSKRLRPPYLARYRAALAACTSVSELVPGRGTRLAMPMLAVM